MKNYVFVINPRSLAPIHFSKFRREISSHYPELNDETEDSLIIFFSVRFPHGGSVFGGEWGIWGGAMNIFILVMN